MVRVQDALAAELAQQSPSADHKEVERKVQRAFKAILGARVRSIVTGGAPTSRAVLQFLRASGAEGM